MVRLTLVATMVSLAGCAPASHTLRRDALTQAGCATTYDCCIQRHPEAPEMCGAESPSVPKVNTFPMTDANKKPWPYEHCVDAYELCKGDKETSPWTGPCDDCLNKCTSSGQWDIERCYPRPSR